MHVEMALYKLLRRVMILTEGMIALLVAPQALAAFKILMI